MTVSKAGDGSWWQLVVLIPLLWGSPWCSVWSPPLDPISSPLPPAAPPLSLTCLAVAGCTRWQPLHAQYGNSSVTRSSTCVHDRSKATGSLRLQAWEKEEHGRKSMGEGAWRTEGVGAV